MPTSWDSLFKKIFLRFFLQLALSVKTQQEVSHQALMIDAVVICQSEADMRKLRDTAFYFFREHNLLEFKSSEDRLTVPGYHRIQSRARLYLSETENLTSDRMTICIISSVDPRSVRHNIPRVSFSRVEQGHYLATGELIETHLYCISQLPVEPKYYPMLLFSKGKKRKQFLKTLVDNNELEYLHLAMLLYPEEVKEVSEMRIGIVGMPYVGKTTVFNALTKSSAETGGYASRRDANVSVVKVPDDRLEPLRAIFKPPKLTCADIEYIDVVGMRKGAVKSGGMDARLLADLRAVDALAHVVRVFEDDKVPHIDGSVEPERDIENLNMELALADLQIIENRLERLNRELRASKDANLVREQELLQKFQVLLESGVPLRETDISDDEEKMIRGYQFLTQKPLLLILNIGEDQIGDTERLLAQFSEYARRPNTSVLAVCAEIEMEIAQLEDDEEAGLFLEEMGLSESAMTRVIHTSYDLLGLITFFTGGDNEVRAWTAKKGTTALAAAGMIHSDMERGFIRAEIIQAEELIECGSLAKAREAGLLRLEGKEYILQEGDFMTVRFSV